MANWLTKSVRGVEFLVISDDPCVEEQNKKFGLKVMKLKEFLETYHKVGY